MKDGILLNEKNRRYFEDYMELSEGRIPAFRSLFFSVWAEGSFLGDLYRTPATKWSAEMLWRLLRSDPDARNALQKRRPLAVIACYAGMYVAPALAGALKVPVLAADDEVTWRLVPRPRTFTLLGNGGEICLYRSKSDFSVLAQGPNVPLNMSLAIDKAREMLKET